MQHTNLIRNTSFFFSYYFLMFFLFINILFTLLRISSYDSLVHLYVIIYFLIIHINYIDFLNNFSINDQFL